MTKEKEVVSDKRLGPGRNGNFVILLWLSSFHAPWVCITYQCHDTASRAAALAQQLAHSAACLPSSASEGSCHGQQVQTHPRAALQMSMARNNMVAVPRGNALWQSLVAMRRGR